MHRNQGFTLLEVLIAGVILFAVMMIMQKGIAIASSSSLVAKRSVNIESVLPNLTNLIKQQLKGLYLQQVTQAKGQFLGVDYEWQATLIEDKPLLRTSFEQVQLGAVASENVKSIQLWSVELRLFTAEKQELYQYSEVIW